MARHVLTPEDGSKGGSKSKRKPFDKRMQEWLQQIVDDGKGNEMSVEDLFRKTLLEMGKAGGGTLPEGPSDSRSRGRGGGYIIGRPCRLLRPSTSASPPRSRAGPWPRR